MRRDSECEQAVGDQGQVPAAAPSASAEIRARRGAPTRRCLARDQSASFSPRPTRSGHQRAANRLTIIASARRILRAHADRQKLRRAEN
jgi:hypothetical protein